MAINHDDGDGTYFAIHIHTLARFYEKHEILPIECQGGKRTGLSHLDDLDVEKAARSWLALQTSRDLTPALFCKALNQPILPELGIGLRKDLCNCTAHHWLIKLGYQRVSLQKGKYMDGHEHKDVAKYFNEVFLPLMKKYVHDSIPWPSFRENQSCLKEPRETHHCTIS